MTERNHRRQTIASERGQGKGERWMERGRRKLQPVQGAGPGAEKGNLCVYSKAGVIKNYQREKR